MPPRRSRPGVCPRLFHRRRFLRLPLPLLLLLVACDGALAQGTDWVREHYTKFEHKIPMRDGKRLFTSVYVPKEDASAYPIMLFRTPYSVRPYGADQYRDSLGPSEAFARQGFIFAYQDVRGCYMSEGEFVNMRPVASAHEPGDVDESTDTYDTIDWLVKNVAGNNGRAGIWGISYPGFYAACGTIDSHPALKAASPQAPIADWFVGDDFHHNGALYLPHFFNFISSFGKPRPELTKERHDRFDHGTPDGYRYFLGLGPLSEVNERWFGGEVAFWDDVVRHPDYDDFWKARNLRPRLRGIKPAVLTVGGWFDAEDCFGALEVYKSIERQNPNADNRLVMGPWSHGGWSRSDGNSLGHVNFAAKTGVKYRDEIEFPFFRHHLLQDESLDLPEASVFETGTNRWRSFDAWPPREASVRALYLRAGGKLSFEPPPEDENGGFDEYPSDPAKPVPFTDEIAIGMTREHMVGDQRFASTRPDVLVYATDVLTEDVTIAGPIRPSLFVSTTATDSDFVVKLIDVYPNDYPDPEPTPETGRVKMGGFEQLVRGEAFRGKYRNSFEKPEPFTPGQPAKIEFAMPDVLHCFRSGHRIMVQIQSSWFPLVDRNPQKFMDIYRATEADMTKATQRVHRAPDMPTSVGLGLIE